LRVGLNHPQGIAEREPGRFQVLFVLNDPGMDVFEGLKRGRENELEKYDRDYDKMLKL
jgi:hypothetical protein